MLDSADVTPQDGRVARSQRTRAAILDALTTLLHEGNPQPTVEEIAARAAVAPRTVFQHFADREALFEALSTSRLPQLQVLMGRIDLDAPREERIAQIVAQRVRVYEWVAAVRRAGLLMEPFSEKVHEALDGFRVHKREVVERVFAPEIAVRPEGERATLAAALGSAASWSTWDARRTHQALDVEAAAAALTLTLRSLLGDR
jgi:TetR/AcrR family transcriptional regulator of autoinduction and epiphytic fitness